MTTTPEFHAYGAAHLTVILLTVVLPFVLAGLVRRSKERLIERAIAFAISGILLINYFVYLFFVRHLNASTWQQSLPIQLCDWAAVVVVITLLTKNQRWFEVAYFWGIGGTLQAILTPNLPFGFPDLRFISFFTAHAGIVVGILFMMLVHKFRPYPMSILRVFAWSEVYFIFTLVADHYTGFNYGFLLHKPEAFSILSFLSDSRPVYLLQMQGVALLFFLVLYVPFVIVDFVRNR